MATIIYLLVLVAMAIELFIVLRKAKQLQERVLGCEQDNNALVMRIQQHLDQLNLYEGKLDKQSEQIAEKNAKINELDKMLSEPKYTHLDAEALGDTIYLVCWNGYTEKKYTHVFGIVTDERLRKELLTKIRKLINYKYCDNYKKGATKG